MNNHYRIGLLLNDFGSEYSLGLEKGITEFCTDRGYTLYVISIGEIGSGYSLYEYQKRAAAAFISTHTVDGLIFQSIPQAATAAVEEVRAYIHSFDPLPVVNIGYEIPDVPSITIDEKSGLRTIIRHLITKHECRNIILMGAGITTNAAAERQQVFREEITAAKMPLKEDRILDGYFTYQEAYSALRDYMRTHGGLHDIDAIVALNDDMACGCIDFCREQNIRIPEDIIVTGYDDILRASYTIPTITSVTQHLSAQGRLAVETLIKKIEGAPVPHLQTIPTKALFRQSCGCVKKTDIAVNAITQNGEIITANEGDYHLTGIEWYKKRFQLQYLIGYQETKRYAQTLPSLRASIINDLRNSNMMSVAICLYDTPVQADTFVHFPLPHEAYVFASHDPITHVNINGSQENIVFDPNNTIIPDGILDDSNGRFYIVPLYQCRIQYGYIVFKPGDYDDTMYVMLCTTISSIIDMSYSFMIEQTSYYTDDLTHLLNERGFMHRGQKLIQSAVANSQSGLVIYGDMDGLKQINDTYGHDAGDRAIAAAAAILSSVFRASDVVGRLHGDEFAVVAAGLTNETFSRIKHEIAEKCAA